MIWKTTLAQLMITILVIPGVLLLPPKEVEAVDLTSSIGSAAAEITAGISACVADSFLSALLLAAPTNVPVSDGAQNSRDCILKSLAWSLANIALETMLVQITAWVQNGFEGAPAFVTDPSSFLSAVVDEAVGQVIADSPLRFLCSEFVLDVQIDLMFQFLAPDSEQFRGCTLSDISGNVDGFLAGNMVDHGGLRSWYEITTKPQQNPTLANLPSQDFVTAVIRTERGEELDLLGWAQGFFSLTDDLGFVDTPGTVVSDQVASWLRMPQERLTIADEINELVGAIVQQLMTGLFEEEGGLLGTSYNTGQGNYGGIATVAQIDLLSDIDDEISIAQASGDFVAETQYANLRQQVAAVDPSSPNALQQLSTLQAQFFTLQGVTNPPPPLGGGGNTGGGGNVPPPPPPPPSTPGTTPDGGSLPDGGGSPDGGIPPPPPPPPPPSSQ